jgi:hypothetical protein
MIAGKVFALITEIHLFFLVADSHMAVLEEFAVFVAATLAVFRSEKIQHLLEIRVFFKNGIVEQGFKPPGIDFKISELFLELLTVSADISVHVSKTGFTGKAAR